MNHVNNFGGAENADEGEASMYFSKCLSVVHLDILFRCTHTRELSELIILKTGNYID